MATKSKLFHGVKVDTRGCVRVSDFIARAGVGDVYDAGMRASLVSTEKDQVSWSIEALDLFGLAADECGLFLDYALGRLPTKVEAGANVLSKGEFEARWLGSRIGDVRILEADIARLGVAKSDYDKAIKSNLTKRMSALRMRLIRMAWLVAYLNDVRSWELADRATINPSTGILWLPDAPGHLVEVSGNQALALIKKHFGPQLASKKRAPRSAVPGDVLTVTGTADRLASMLSGLGKDAAAGTQVQMSDAVRDALLSVFGQIERCFAGVPNIREAAHRNDKEQEQEAAA